MQYLYAIIFGFVQGITEFVPISSSGHLFILHRIIDLPIVNELAFDVVLHFASLLAVMVFFQKEIWALLLSFLNLLRGKRDNYSKLAFLLLIGTVPAALAGYFFDSLIESVFRSVYVVAFMLFFGGMLFIIFERLGRKVYAMDNLSLSDSLIIGFAQAIALIPGTSRSGITIAAGMFRGLTREAAVRFSFLLSIPIILGASLFKISEISFASLPKDQLNILFVSFIASFISAFFAIKYFIKFVKKYSLNVFAFYRFILAIAILFMNT